MIQLFNFRKKQATRSLEPCGIASTCYPEQKTSFNDLMKSIHNQVNEIQRVKTNEHFKKS